MTDVPTFIHDESFHISRVGTVYVGDWPSDVKTGLVGQVVRHDGKLKTITGSMFDSQNKVLPPLCSKRTKCEALTRACGDTHHRKGGDT